jgi:hypothetical protein
LNLSLIVKHFPNRVLPQVCRSLFNQRVPNHIDDTHANRIHDKLAILLFGVVVLQDDDGYLFSPPAGNLSRHDQLSSSMPSRNRLASMSTTSRLGAGSIMSDPMTSLSVLTTVTTSR